MNYFSNKDLDTAPPLKEVLKVCQKCVSYFTLTRNCHGREQIQHPPESRVFQQHKGHLISSAETCEWFAYWTFPESPTPGLEVHTFRFDGESQNILTDFFQDLFLSERKEEHEPDDLCLFREDGALLLGTVSHEHIAELFPEADEMDLLERLKFF